MKKTFIILSVLALVFGDCGQSLYAQFKIPKGYKDYSEGRIYIDFDGDGKKDTATIIISNDQFYSNNFAASFLIYLTSDNKNHIVELENGGIGHFTEFKVKNNVIQFGYFLNGTRARFHAFKLRYNHTKRKIQLIGFDFGHRISGTNFSGYTSISYNLLTGDYHVTNDIGIFIGSDVRPRKDFHKGNKKMRAVFLEDINDELFEKLFSVGNEFNIDGCYYELKKKKSQ